MVSSEHMQNIRNKRQAEKFTMRQIVQRIRTPRKRYIWWPWPHQVMPGLASLCSESSLIACQYVEPLTLTLKYAFTDEEHEEMCKHPCKNNPSRFFKAGNI